VAAVDRNEHGSPSAVAGEGVFLEYDHASQLMNQLLWNSMLIAAPMLITAMVVGLIISIVQVATQLQEMTLSYVPKLVASGAVLVLLGPWMLHRLTQFAIELIATIPDLG
jgi:flagellar biosynthetic protein FliQ